MKKYLGIIGDPIEHSLSPIMHNAALEKQKLDYIYLPFQVTPDNLKDALKGFKALNIVGVNVTIPYKVAVMSYLDQISEEAALIGAINTIHLKDGKWIGYNTDGIGFLRSLREDGGTDPEGLRVLLFGAGGAARAVAVQLGLSKAKEIVIANRTRKRGEDLAKELGGKISTTSFRAVGFTPGELKEEMKKAQIIVNATPVGMKSITQKELPLKLEWFRPEHLVVELVYRPLKTPLLKMARSAGASILSGEGMLLYQGAEAYKIWTGMEPPIEVMRRAILDQLKKED
ncbi:shikimate dehydrogenase [Anoxybacter fermentans]|uniref:Shikimate dehydrogenase (NADP(+)) n=1 Tax=Anoxybacter fermentans TaxID=1323375 RepID=A0A3S9T0V2_9FIRM|nr:shikimate dehydrogenase [Anoxybacter fermentans]AZR74181.1 shikimate dehydrogenase [Anoxybacter fermentans]